MKLLASLTNRVFLASALLAMLSIGVAIYLVNYPVTREGERELQRGMREAGQLLDEHRRTLSESFRIMAELVADLPVLKAAMDTHHPPTVEPIAADYRSRVKADLLVVTDRADRVLASVGSSSLSEGYILTQPAIQSALAGARSSVFWPHPDGILQVVTVPVTLLEPPQVLGTLSLGFLLDDDLARQFKSITDSEIAFAIDGEIKASTLQPTFKTQLASLLQHGEAARIVLGDHDYVSIVRPLSPQGESTGPAAAVTSGVPVALILRSRTERLQFVRSIHTMLAVTALAAVLMATGLSYAVSRTVTRPLGAITSAMKELARTGDLTRKIELRPGGWMDEDARLLATTFNTLTESIARFQREVAERERLTSLGRLSTVVAHEVRNPLLIIKASLRTLRGDATADEAREAIADIDEETRRLNRIVNEVLDYARPIVYEWSEADLNEICRSSVAQAMGSAEDGRGPRVRANLAPDVPRIVTDAERLRTALTNLLTNARQAVEAHPSVAGQTSRPDIEISTGSAGPDRVSIVIRDRGVGIEPSELPRVFDPYFTTKRSGTGIGLAISRNIIEGMGGGITLASEPGSGTEVRLDLPVRPAADIQPLAS